MPNHDELLSSKELAWVLKRDVDYVYRMRRLGFLMIGGRTTLNNALLWLKSNGSPYSKRNSAKVRICR